MFKKSVHRKDYSTTSLIPSIVAVVRAEIECPTAFQFCTLADYPKYNHLDRSLSEYFEKTNHGSFPINASSDESRHYHTSQLNSKLPRTSLLQKALVQLQFMPPRIDLITHRGDLVDLALSFIPNEFNGFSKIDHIVYRSHGRLLLFHDRLRDDTFNSAASRDNWYSGQKFEQMCTTTEWPEDLTKWQALKPQSHRDDPIHNILELPLSSQLNALVIAENDCRDSNIEGIKSLIELKCTGAYRITAGTQWNNLANAQVLNTLIHGSSVIKFMKMCLQIRLCGTEEIVIGIRERKKLVCVRRFNISEIEKRIKACLKQKKQTSTHFQKFYLQALHNIATFIDSLSQKCEEDKFYRLTKSHFNQPIEIKEVSEDSLIFKEPFLDEFEELLSESMAERQLYIKKHRTKQAEKTSKKHVKTTIESSEKSEDASKVPLKQSNNEANPLTQTKIKKNRKKNHKKDILDHSTDVKDNSMIEGQKQLTKMKQPSKKSEHKASSASNKSSQHPSHGQGSTLIEKCVLPKNKSDKKSEKRSNRNSNNDSTQLFTQKQIRPQSEHAQSKITLLDIPTGDLEKFDGKYVESPGTPLENKSIESNKVINILMTPPPSP